MYEIFERLLKEKQLRAADISKATGIPASTFTDWKKGRSEPKLEKIRKIADFLGVSEKYLLTGEKDEDLLLKADMLDAQTKQLLDLYNNLDDESKKELVSYAEFKAESYKNDPDLKDAENIGYEYFKKYKSTQSIKTKAD